MATAAEWGRSALRAAAIVTLAVAVFLVARRVILGADLFTIENARPLLSSVDGAHYRVHHEHAEPQQAADTLAALNGRVVGLMRALRGRYVRGPAGAAHPARREATARLLERYNPDNLAENSPNDPSGDTSYTIGKGAVVALCLRDRAAPGRGIHDLDTLTFVTLHEMAHIAVKEVDHPPQFWRAFRFLLEESEAAGVYSSANYAEAPRQYCGMRIDYNPRFDARTSSI
jgi:hypothetical protein